ncbi:hypothetical protein PVAP13_3KG484318 [Panicum virgatum]|uniref:Uncharacterized protein n=1 Tax=Panicum virgatum TaxID=38727 RepID=A0A8T0V1Q7_PANVG|nr:hypothetical protein PVAP13_3KG484318 [Panicum virgatum]
MYRRAPGQNSCLDCSKRVALRNGALVQIHHPSTLSCEAALTHAFFILQINVMTKVSLEDEDGRRLANEDEQPLEDADGQPLEDADSLRHIHIPFFLLIGFHLNLPLDEFGTVDFNFIQNITCK